MTADGDAEARLYGLWRDGARAFAALAAGMESASGADARGDAGADASAWRLAARVFDGWRHFVDAIAAAHAARAGAESAPSSPFDPAGWLRGDGAGGMADLWRWLEGPAFADLRGEERRLLRETREFIAFNAALEHFRLVVAGGWLRAFRAFAERLAGDDPETRPTDPPGDTAAGPALGGTAWDRLTAHWRVAADAEFARVQASDPYLAAQRDLLDAGLALRASLRERAETTAAFLGLPTRAEFDDLAATVHALRREVRALRRAGRGATGAPSGAADPEPGATPGPNPGSNPGPDPGPNPGPNPGTAA
ncbi:MAG: poly(R)-hydroxyalkanoic acid synthase subunit PhaE [Pseudomonadota bacterium]